MNKLAKLLGTTPPQGPHTNFNSHSRTGDPSYWPTTNVVTRAHSNSASRSSIPTLFRPSDETLSAGRTRRPSEISEDLHQLNLTADDIASEHFSMTGSLQNSTRSRKRRGSAPCPSPITFSHQPPEEHFASQDDHDEPTPGRAGGGVRYYVAYTPPPSPRSPLHNRSSSTPFPTKSLPSKYSDLTLSSTIFSTSTSTSILSPHRTMITSPAQSISTSPTTITDMAASPSSEYRRSFDMLESAFSTSINLDLYVCAPTSPRDPPLSAFRSEYGLAPASASRSGDRDVRGGSSSGSHHSNSHQYSRSEDHSGKGKRRARDRSGTDSSYGMERTSYDEDNDEEYGFTSSYTFDHHYADGQQDSADGDHEVGGSVGGGSHGGTEESWDWEGEWSYQEMQDVIRLLRDLR
ncbi:hypothetical protein BDN72DRAFT_203307 [Pluteus cervinus]|uniref:Uncharacterized protein n=1 Tax=Pluteus cervinus TaxID=181527 RepID=A0ACD3AIM8_9AGAR|nr:hypothetical protein BDN72DRAFT_203307 [Pluteus cervinus]